MSVDALADAWEAAWSGRRPARVRAALRPGPPLRGPAPRRAAARRRRRSPSTPRRLWRAFPDVRLERAGARLTRRSLRGAAGARARAQHRARSTSCPASHRAVELHIVFWCELDLGAHAAVARARGLRRLRGGGRARADPAARHAAQPRAARCCRATACACSGTAARGARRERRLSCPARRCPATFLTGAELDACRASTRCSTARSS